MPKALCTLVGSGALLLLVEGAALAGPQYVDGSDYAVSGYDVVAYFDKSQAAIGKPQPAPTPGKTSFTAEYNGATFAFATSENRDRFIADPARYAPQFNGHCAFGVAKGGKVPGDPQRWRIVDGKLYLNLQKSVAEMWEEDIPGFIQAANDNWQLLSRTPRPSARQLSMKRSTLRRVPSSLARIWPTTP